VQQLGEPATHIRQWPGDRRRPPPGLRRQLAAIAVWMLMPPTPPLRDDLASRADDYRPTGLCPPESSARPVL